MNTKPAHDAVLPAVSGATRYSRNETTAATASSHERNHRTRSCFGTFLGDLIRIARSGPQLPYVFDLHFGDESDARLKWRVANVFWHDYNHNKKHEDRKARALTCAISLFVIQTVLLLATLLVVAVSPSSGSTRRSECPARAVRDAQAQAPAPALAKSPPAQPLAAVPHSLAADHNRFYRERPLAKLVVSPSKGYFPLWVTFSGRPRRAITCKSAVLRVAAGQFGYLSILLAKAGRSLSPAALSGGTERGAQGSGVPRPHGDAHGRAGPLRRGPLPRLTHFTRAFTIG